MSNLIAKMAELDQRGQPFVVVTIVDSVGSAPQDTGAKMLVDHSGLVQGTVGGGRIEHKAINTAQQLIRDKGPTASLFEWNLQTDVGMTCGGVVKLFFEIFNMHRWRIAIFGAGHVAQALIRNLIQLECHVLCFDPREDWLQQLPPSPRLTMTRTDDLASQVAELEDSDFVLCMTMGHRTDRPILERVFKEGRQFSYLGVIGSRAKRKVLERELRDAGVPHDRAKQFICPIGLPVGTNQPSEIAISIVAQLLQHRDNVPCLD